MFKVFLNEEFDKWFPEHVLAAWYRQHMLTDGRQKVYQLSLTLSEAALRLVQMAQRRWPLWTKGKEAKKAGAPDSHFCC